MKKKNKKEKKQSKKKVVAKEKQPKKKAVVLSKAEKKKQQENKKILNIVKREFHYDKDVTKSCISKDMVKSITKSAIVNNTLIEKDRKAVKNWQKEYYNELFSTFKNLVMKHNEKMVFKADILASKILAKKTELNKLKAEVKKLQAEKEILEHA